MLSSRTAERWGSSVDRPYCHIVAYKQISQPSVESHNDASVAGLRTTITPFGTITGHRKQGVWRCSLWSVVQSSLEHPHTDRQPRPAAAVGVLPGQNTMKSCSDLELRNAGAVPWTVRTVTFSNSGWTIKILLKFSHLALQENQKK